MSLVLCAYGLPQSHRKGRLGATPSGLFRNCREGPVPLHSNLKVEPIWLTISDRLPPRRRGCVWLRGSLLRVRPMSAAVAFRSAAIDIAGWVESAGLCRKSTGRGPIISRADFSAIPISLRQRAKIHSETVCTTLLTGRLLTVGSLTSFKSASSYCERVCTGAFAFICTTL
jgi:hypothetical protein